MMDYEKLIRRLRNDADAYRNGKTLGRAFADQEDVLDNAATALSTLQAENEKLRAELEQAGAEITRLKHYEDKCHDCPIVCAKTEIIKAHEELEAVQAELEQKSKLIAQQAAELERRDKLLKEQEGEGCGSRGPTQTLPHMEVGRPEGGMTWESILPFLTGNIRRRSRQKDLRFPRPWLLGSVMNADISTSAKVIEAFGSRCSHGARSGNIRF